jgi:hypothetical protein
VKRSSNARHHHVLAIILLVSEHANPKGKKMITDLLPSSFDCNVDGLKSGDSQR